MYWWNYKKLAIALRDGTIKPWQMKVYWAFFLLIYTSLLVLFVYTESSSSPHKGGNFVVQNIIAAIGTISLIVSTYHNNKIGDNKDYLERFVCINFPVAMRYMVIFSIPTTLIYFIQVVMRMLKVCPDINDQNAFYSCVMPQIGSLLEPSYIDLGLYTLSFLVFIHWYRKAFRIASTKDLNVLSANLDSSVL